MLRVSRMLVERLHTEGRGLGLLLRNPRKVWKQNTGGWSAKLGTLGKALPSIEVWLDRYSGHEERKLSICFFSRNGDDIDKLASASDKLWPVRRITDGDVKEERAVATLAQRLRRNEFNAPLLEHYENWGTHFLSVFHPTTRAGTPVDEKFCDEAVAFVLDVASTKSETAEHETREPAFPQCENRRLVQAHLARERSRLLAVQCKERDKFRCQVCDFHFGETYGARLGAGFAEAHHKVPLSTLGDQVKTRLEDLITVCANCHRMLHRMEGKVDDIRKLKAIRRKNRH